jgi:Protein of unknown function (DUF2924)
MSPSSSPGELAVLAGLETKILRFRWAELFGAEPINRISRELLIRGIAYRLQERAEGGPAKKTLRQLDRLAKEFGSSGTVKMDGVSDLRPGTRLVREWQGRVHEVIVLDDGFLWKGHRYRSLSEIARLITGTRWSGPRFFGTLATKDKPASAESISSPAPAEGVGDG